jgi:hypothetical protein
MITGPVRVQVAGDEPAIGRFLRAGLGSLTRSGRAISL